MQTRISTEDFFGIFYVRKPNGLKWDSYYKTIDVLRPLFDSGSFREIISGFYLNVCGNLDSVRISYFVNEKKASRSVSIFRDFFANNGLTEIETFSAPRKAIIAQSYGGMDYEERFRDFLARETQIGLEIMKGNLLHSRRLFATYRWQVRKASLSFEEHFEPTFEKYSQTYNSYSPEEKSQFFADLKEWPNPPQFDWGHFIVNLVLGGDWFVSQLDYLTPGRPMPINKINRILLRSGMGFQIPEKWKPTSFDLKN